MAKTILTTTGFVLPESGLYTMFEKKHYELEDFIGRNDNFNYKSRLNFFIDNGVHFSSAANELYRNYIRDRSFVNFMAMVDYCADILSKVDVKTFLQLQAANRYTSNMSLLLCKDILNEKMVGNHLYDSVPPDSRFVMDNPITKHEAAERYKKLLARPGQDPARVNWVMLIAPMVEDKGSFVTMFRYFFVDRF